MGLVRLTQETFRHRRSREVTHADRPRGARGIAYVPEGGVFPNLTVRENLLVAARKAGCDGRDAWSLARILATFLRWPNASTGGQQLSGASSRCSRSAARCRPTPTS